MSSDNQNDSSIENASVHDVALENRDNTENIENTQDEQTIKTSETLESKNDVQKSDNDEAGLVSDYLVQSSEEFEKAIEAVIYVEGTVTVARLAKIFMSTDEKVRDTIALINAKYKEAGSVIEIIEVGENFMMTVAPSVFGVLSRIYDKKRKKKISKSFLQTLSIIAYKQPITKAEIDEIRQSDSSYHVKALLDDGFIEWKGRKDILNKPQTYGTTDKFLMHFNINSIADLPKLRELKELEFDKDV